jgi:hypothetical protein
MLLTYHSGLKQRFLEMGTDFLGSTRAMEEQSDHTDHGGKRGGIWL